MMRLLICSGLLLLLSGCAFRRISRTRHIAYTAAAKSVQELNVFAPRKSGKSHPVLIFIHGGNWNSGRKEQYNWLGSRFARKGIVTVIIDYPLSPAASWNDMAAASAQAVGWVANNIGQYGGNPHRLFVSGHSAGGHLAALIATDDAYFRAAGISGNPLAGTILIDAAGLDMYGYLKDEGGLMEEPSYAVTFTRDTAVWKAATPLYHIHKGMPPFLLFRGGRTYPSIIRSNDKFVAALRDMGLQPPYILEPHKKHIPMILQFFNTSNRRYKDIRQFINE